LNQKCRRLPERQRDPIRSLTGSPAALLKA
jgi:hypothetical protein